MTNFEAICNKILCIMMYWFMIPSIFQFIDNFNEFGEIRICAFPASNWMHLIIVNLYLVPLINYWIAQSCKGKWCAWLSMKGSVQFANLNSPREQIMREELPLKLHLDSSTRRMVSWLIMLSEISFTFHCIQVNSQLISNVCTDALSAEKVRIAAFRLAVD